MSSLRNAEKSAGRAHRERHQPEWRSSLGELEKKQDYRKRAKDFNAKRDTLNALKGKALEKNPDEFHHHMINSRVNEKGVHVEVVKADPETSDPAHLALLASADARYIRYKLQLEKKKIEKLQATLHLTSAAGSAGSGKHLVFVDSKEEAEALEPAQHLDTPAQLLKRRANRPRKGALEAGEWSGAASVGESQRRKAYSELRKRLERKRELQVVLGKLETKAALAGSAKKGGAKPKRVAKGNARNPAVYQCQYERKK